MVIRDEEKVYKEWRPADLLDILFPLHFYFSAHTLYLIIFLVSGTGFQLLVSLFLTIVEIAFLFQEHWFLHTVLGRLDYTYLCPCRQFGAGRQQVLPQYALFSTFFPHTVLQSSNAMAARQIWGQSAPKVVGYSMPNA